MNVQKLKRAGIRSSFTRTANVLKLELIKEDIDLNIVKDKFSKLQNLQTELKDLDERILDLLVEGKASEAEVEKEIEDRELYSDDFITLTRQVTEKLQISDEGNFETRSNDGTSISGNKIKSYKLPKIELKKFDGELINWLPFWSQFDKIHNDPDLHDSDKFSYLVQSMKTGSRAKEFIESYPVTSENYDKAVVALKERFGKPELLIEVYVRELIKLIISNVKADWRDKLPLDKLFDKIEAQLRALESLGLKAKENSSWLYPMVESSLTEEVLKAWQRSSFFNQPEGADLSRLTNLMKFLKAEVEGEERLKLARSGFDSVNRKEGYHDKTRGDFQNKFRLKKPPKVPTAAGFLTTKDRSCIFCSKSHDSKNCYEARLLPLNEKISRIKEKKCCLKCLEPNHFAKVCKQFVRCYVCGKAHLICLCPEMHNKSEATTENQVTENVQITTARPTCTAEVALMTLQVKLVGNKGTKNIRALLDCGSQKSYILKATVEELGFSVVSRETVAHTLFGGARTNPKPHNKYKIKVSSSDRYRGPELEFEFFDQEIICGDIPRIPKGPLLSELKHHKIWLSDMGSDSPKIEMLIGSDIYGRIISGQVKQLRGGLTAINTKLGWTVCGKFDDCPRQRDENVSILYTSLCSKNVEISDLWSLETIGISEMGHNLTKAAEEEIAKEQFLSSLSRNNDGRYCVGLPWYESNSDLPSNRYIAEKRLFSTTRKLKSLNKYEEYDKIFKEWLEEGVIEEVPNSELDLKCHYLPHHPVFKPDSLTTKIRPVFDASCKVNRSPSLNDCLMKGPNLIEQIPAILLRFREKCIGVTSDIRRAFLQIELRKEDRDYLRFLWWEKGDVIKIFRHARVVFGVTSSPFLLGAVITYHLSQVPAEQRYITQKLEQSLYVDNCVTSVDNEKELTIFMNKSTEILAEAQMDLRLWTFGPIERESDLAKNFNNECVPENTSNVLGLLWDKINDSFAIPIKLVPITENLTKRNILSRIQGIFDPVGFLAPVLLSAKLLLQELWLTKIDWESPLPEETQIKFKKWSDELHFLSDLRFPRRVGFGSKDCWSLHVFCDSSQNAYATVIFLRCEDDDAIFVSFLMAKSRVAPLRRMTIPRLELLACVLGARLSKYVVEAPSLVNIPTYYWSDSTTALSWIQRNDQWGTFEGNRVKEICTLTSVNEWSYVPGRLNPADLPSQGCSPRQIVKSEWWKGPDWLKGPKVSWPNIEVKADEGLISSELRKKVMKLNVNLNVNTSKWYSKFSKFSVIVRILAWVLRFINNSRGKTVNKAKFLSATEIQVSKHTLSLLVQKESFSQAGDEVHGLSIIRDDTGLIRVKTKILERNDDFGFKYPILLPSKHHIVESLILEYHKDKSHAGIQTLMSMIREEFWIIAARRTIRAVIRKCVTCKRFTSKATTTVPTHLPVDRVRDALAFEVAGVDLCGPLILRNAAKVWVVLFTCAVYRAVHLELVTSLSAECFSQALRRFIARRGRPTVIYSDNGTNFAGVANALKRVEWQKLTAHDIISPIEWKFNPPTAPWWGGWWERLIRSVKDILVRVLGRSSVTYEELLTVLCDAEAVMNERPLTYISNNVKELVPLTPSNFLREVKESGTADLDYVDRKKLLNRQQFCQELREQFRQRFRKEYLSQLVQKAGSANQVLKVGEVVLVGSENQKRLSWPLAVIEELYPGRDGHTRVVKVKTPHGHLVRPVQKIYPLEVNSSEDPILSKARPVNGTTSVGANGSPIVPISQASTEGAPTASLTRHPVHNEPVPLVVPRASSYGRIIKTPQKLNL